MQFYAHSSSFLLGKILPKILTGSPKQGHQTKEGWENKLFSTPCPGKNGPPKQNAVKCTVYNTIQ